MDTTPIPKVSDGPIPEKYIRTFASDMDIFQRGGTPGLAPFKKGGSSPAERLVGASPVSLESETKAPEPAPVPIPLTAGPVAPPSPLSITTYAEDFRERLKTTNASTATILAAEQDAGPANIPLLDSKKETINMWYVALGITLFALGGVGAYFAYSRYLVAVTPIVVAPIAATPIFVDSRATVSGTGSTLANAIEQSANTPIAPGTVRLLALSSSTSTDASVFSELGVPAPGILLRNINAAGSMAGVVSASSGPSPFFILSVGSYGATFSGMLSWEAKMPTDLGVLFPAYSVPVVTTASSTASTTTPVPAASIVQAGFRDETVNNHDVRVYRDAQDRSVLIYGYWNQSTLIIARDPAAFTELLGRLATSHS